MPEKKNNLEEEIKQLSAKAIDEILKTYRLSSKESVEEASEEEPECPKTQSSAKTITDYCQFLVEMTEMMIGDTENILRPIMRTLDSNQVLTFDREHTKAYSCDLKLDNSAPVLFQDIYVLLEELRKNMSQVMKSIYLSDIL